MLIVSVLKNKYGHKYTKYLSYPKNKGELKMAGYTVEIDIGSGRENGHDVKVLDFITGNYITDDCNECDVCEECSRYDDIKSNIGRVLSYIDLNETYDAEIETIVRDTLGDDYGVHHGTYVHRD